MMSPVVFGGFDADSRKVRDKVVKWMMYPVVFGIFDAGSRRVQGKVVKWMMPPVVLGDLMKIPAKFRIKSLKLVK